MKESAEPQRKWKLEGDTWFNAYCAVIKPKISPQMCRMEKEHRIAIRSMVWLAKNGRNPYNKGELDYKTYYTVAASIIAPRKMQQ